MSLYQKSSVIGVLHKKLEIGSDGLDCQFDNTPVLDGVTFEGPFIIEFFLVVQKILEMVGNSLRLLNLLLRLQNRILLVDSQKNIFSIVFLIVT